MLFSTVRILGALQESSQTRTWLLTWLLAPERQSPKVRVQEVSRDQSRVFRPSLTAAKYYHARRKSVSQVLFQRGMI